MTARPRASNCKCGIFWDLDGNAIPPVGMSIGDACEALRNFGVVRGELCEFKAYISPASDSELSQATRLSTDLQQHGVSLSLHRPPGPGPSGTKEYVLITDLMIFILDHGLDACVVLVSNDYISLGYPLSLLRNRLCMIIILSPGDLAHAPKYVQSLDTIWDVRGDDGAANSTPAVLAPNFPSSSSPNLPTRPRSESLDPGSNTPTATPDNIRAAAPPHAVATRPTTGEPDTEPPLPSRPFDIAPGVGRPGTVYDSGVSAAMSPRTVAIVTSSPWSFSTLSSHSPSYDTQRPPSRGSVLSSHETATPTWPPHSVANIFPGAFSVSQPVHDLATLSNLDRAGLLPRHGVQLSTPPISSHPPSNPPTGSSGPFSLSPAEHSAEHISGFGGGPPTRGLPSSNMAAELRLLAQLQPHSETFPQSAEELTPQDPNATHSYDHTGAPAPPANGGGTISATSSSALSSIGVPSASSTSPEHISFHPLIRVLEKFRSMGTTMPLRSAVGSELRLVDPKVYERAGVRTFKEYAGIAERRGIIALIGGSPGKEKITLVK
ncbi:hypothetical protein BS47DRAFT_593827 [Hydnum rufescens UP504]|uniref:NYN domain-containing protein n=1 Tax=Hydnum rufescens UP504 TaxID=1448309 RepID=A0A9P6B3H8_9AGAM|nr:hypothetical protein BS47DRAFT_593827 [Hydnum rufescens UP504]